MDARRARKRRPAIVSLHRPCEADYRNDTGRTQVPGILLNNTWFLGAAGAAGLPSHRLVQCGPRRRAACVMRARAMGMARNSGEAQQEFHNGKFGRLDCRTSCLLVGLCPHYPQDVGLLMLICGYLLLRMMADLLVCGDETARLRFTFQELVEDVKQAPKDVPQRLRDGL